MHWMEHPSRHKVEYIASLLDVAKDVDELWQVSQDEVRKRAGTHSQCKVVYEFRVRSARDLL